MLTEEAKQGLEFLKKSNPELARQVSKTMSDTGDDISGQLQQMEKKAKKIKKQINDLPSADEMGNTGDTTASAEETDAEEEAEKDARNANSEAAGAMGASTLQELRDSRQKARESAQQATQQYQQAVQGITPESQIRQQQAEKAGLQTEQQDVSQQEAKVAEIKGQLAEIRQEKRAKMDKAEDRLASTSQIKAEQQRIRKEYNREIADVSSILSGETALLQAEQGQLERAQTNIQNAVDAKLRSQERELQRMRRVASSANDWYSSLDETTQDYMDRVQEQKENALKRQRDRADTNRQLILDAWKRGVSVPSELVKNITTTPTEDVMGVVGPKLAQKAREEETGESRDVMSMNEIDQFRRNYNWSPPYGFTEEQVLQYMKDNPNKTPEQLEEGARQVLYGGEKEEKEEPTQTPDEVVSYINENMTDEQLYKLKEKSDEADISSIWRHKTTDVKNYLNSIKGKIQTALDEGYTKEKILEFLAK